MTTAPATTRATTRATTTDDDHGDDEDGDDVNEHGDDDDDQCSADALKAGTKVHEAELEVTSAGKHWEELELIEA